jgi:hypothetical protein
VLHEGRVEEADADPEVRNGASEVDDRPENHRKEIAPRAMPEDERHSEGGERNGDPRQVRHAQRREHEPVPVEAREVREDLGLHHQRRPREHVGENSGGEGGRQRVVRPLQQAQPPWPALGEVHRELAEHARDEGREDAEGLSPGERALAVGQREVPPRDEAVGGLEEREKQEVDVPKAARLDRKTRCVHRKADADAPDDEEAHEVLVGQFSSRLQHLMQLDGLRPDVGVPPGRR